MEKRPNPVAGYANRCCNAMRSNVPYAALVGAIVAHISLSLANAQSAQPPKLSLPIACNINVDCWIVQYFDHDPGPGARDYANGSRTNNNRQATDFALRDIAAMEEGVAVLAAADGKVRARRDGMDDINVKTIKREAIKGRECGNGVVIDHATGWATQYCHLRKGSVTVLPGQAVKTGDVIGFVGLSGNTEYPHLLLNVLHNNKKVDPFAFDDKGGETHQLWTAAASNQMPYERTSIYSAGFRETVPDRVEVNLGEIKYHSISSTSPAIVFWTGIFGVRAGDKIQQSVQMPNGRVLAIKEHVLKSDQARRFEWVGETRNIRRWPAGDYTGRITLTPANGRDQKPLSREIKITIAETPGN